MYSKVRVHTVIILLFVFLTVQVQKSVAIPSNDAPEVEGMNFTQLCTIFRQPCEEHTVMTEDGYLLRVFRIKGDETKPVLLWHALFVSSDTYILRGQNSTAISLAAAGYDVWLGNSRGNIYSRRHVSLDPDIDKKQFWDFSSHEKGYYDMPATIDYILNNTGQEQLSAIGHSQGTTMFYILASTRPEYNKKIKLFISMAPIAYLSNIKGIGRAFLKIWPILSALATFTDSYEVLNEQSAVNKIVRQMCTQKKGYCRDSLMELEGEDPEELETDFTKQIIGRFPSSISKKDFDYYAQTFKSKRFRYFDYGFSGNLKKYRSFTPPEYDLSKVVAPVALLCALNDYASRLEDVALLKSELSNVVYYQVVDRMECNHMDFVFGKHMNVYVNPILKKLLKQYA